MRTILAIACVVFGCISPDVEPPAAEQAIDEEPVELLPRDNDQWEPQASLKECMTACSGGPDAIAEFCRSIPDPRLRAGCWALQFAGKTACVGWCLWWF
jgi:hypothetical protein